MRTMECYRGTLRSRCVAEGDRCFAQWWARSLPAWLGSLRRHVDG